MDGRTDGDGCDDDHRVSPKRVLQTQKQWKWKKIKKQQIDVMKMRITRCKRKAQTKPSIEQRRIENTTKQLRTAAALERQRTCLPACLPTYIHKRKASGYNWMVTFGDNRRTQYVDKQPQCPDLTCIGLAKSQMDVQTQDHGPSIQQRSFVQRLVRMAYVCCWISVWVFVVFCWNTLKAH